MITRPLNPADLAGARVTVMGLGRFGGGLGVTRYLARQGAQVLLTDLASADALATPLATLTPLVERSDVTLRLGEHNVSDFTTCDLVVASPAVPRPWENRFLRAAQAAGIPITTEIELALRALPAGVRTLGVTGTAGKSTTSAMLHATLAAHAPGHAHLGGNIGGSLLDSLDAIRSGDDVVLELSSAMLHWLRQTDALHPDVAVLTTFAPNHIDWHGNAEHYRASKQVLFDVLRPGTTAVLGSDVNGFRVPNGVREICVKPTDRISELAVPGAHNARNAGAAVCAASVFIPRDIAISTVRLFAGLPHRLQRITPTPDNLHAFNDSKSTTPEATQLAVDACAPLGPVRLIAGGADKGVDLSPIASLTDRLAGLYTIGATGPAIASAAIGAHPCGDLDTAVRTALNHASPGDVLLLSPGCASWDQFDNYERRGERFAELVRAAAGAPA